MAGKLMGTAIRNAKPTGKPRKLTEGISSASGWSR